MVHSATTQDSLRTSCCGRADRPHACRRDFGSCTRGCDKPRSVPALGRHRGQRSRTHATQCAARHRAGTTCVRIADQTFRIPVRSSDRDASCRPETLTALRPPGAILCCVRPPRSCPRLQRRLLGPVPATARPFPRRPPAEPRATTDNLSKSWRGGQGCQDGEQSGRGGPAGRRRKRGGIWLANAASRQRPSGGRIRGSTPPPSDGNNARWIRATGTRLRQAALKTLKRKTSSKLATAVVKSWATRFRSATPNHRKASRNRAKMASARCKRKATMPSVLARPSRPTQSIGMDCRRTSTSQVA